MSYFSPTISIQYLGTLEDGTVVDDNRNGKPLDIVVGTGSVPPGLEKAICQLEPGQETHVTLDPADAFGEYQSEAVFEVPLSQIPRGDELPVGGYILWYGDKKRNKSGRPAIAQVVSVSDSTVVIDLNHPLAGKRIDYWVKVVGETVDPLPDYRPSGSLD